MTQLPACPASGRPSLARTPGATPQPPAPRPLAQPTPHPADAPIPSDELLRGRTSLHIAHNGAIYRLQATRQGRLILTK